MRQMWITGHGAPGKLALRESLDPQPMGKELRVRVNPVTLMNKNRSVFGVNLGHLWHETGKLRSWMDTLLQGVTEGWVRPHVDRAFPLESAAEAHAYIEARRNIGKVVLVP